MLVVFVKEFRHLFFSIRALFFIIFFTLSGILLEKLFSATSTEIGFLDNSTYAVSFFVVIKFTVILFGYLFASILSHSCINREVESKSIRLTISKISRTNFLIGKFLAIIAFWAICLGIAYAFIFFKYHVFDFGELCISIVAMIYYNSIIVFLSTVVNKSVASNFLGLVVSILLPALGLYSFASKNLISVLRFIFPYNYMNKIDISLIIPLGIAGTILGAAILYFKRKDL